MDFAYIDTSKIIANPNNPRGIEIAQQDTKLPLLRDSIRLFGILVPLVVVKRKDKFLLIDGERRFVAAKSLGLKKIPAYINDNELTDDELLFQMFHIHHNREQWGPIQQCHALERVYIGIIDKKEIKSIENEEAKIKAIAEQLANDTGIEPRTALSRIYFLRWPMDVKDNLYKHPTDAYWYICEIEEKIIIPAELNYPEYFETVPVDEVRKDLFEKLEHHSIKRATDVREAARITKTKFTNPSDRKKALKILRNLHKNKDMTYEEARDEYIKEFPSYQETPITPKRLQNQMRKLINEIQNIELDKINEYKGASRVNPKILLENAQEALEALTGFISEIKDIMKRD
jgi:ParB/RepB/Spo0J family partition protein